MVLAMTADLVAARGDLTHQVGIPLGHLAQDEERDRDAVAIEQIEQRARGRDDFSAGPIGAVEPLEERARVGNRARLLAVDPAARVVPLVEVDRDDERVFGRRSSRVRATPAGTPSP